jgi:hypothetical protein
MSKKHIALAISGAVVVVAGAACWLRDCFRFAKSPSQSRLSEITSPSDNDESSSSASSTCGSAALLQPQPELKPLQDALLMPGLHWKELAIIADAEAAEKHGHISFRDHFAGITVTLSLSHIPWLPVEQAALTQVTRPMRLMIAAAWFLGRRWPAAGRQRLRQQPLQPLDCLHDSCSARVLVRVMFGFAATACRRLTSAPGDGTTWCLAGWVMERVSRGRVRRVQVQPQRRACCLAPHVCVL